MRHTPVIDRLVVVVRAHPGIAPSRAAAAVGPNGSVQYGMRAVGRAVRAGRLVRTKRPGAEHVGELWLPGEAPEDRVLWGQARLEGM